MAFSGTCTMVDLDCWVCGIRFAVTEGFDYAKRKQGKPFTCPNGCLIHYGETEASKLQKQLMQERASHDQTRARLSDSRAYANKQERRVSAAHGQITKIKNRVGNGVCPCCNRTFADLARHMASKHPTYKNGMVIEK